MSVDQCANGYVNLSVESESDLEEARFLACLCAIDEDLFPVVGGYDGYVSVNALCCPDEENESALDSEAQWRLAIFLHLPEVSDLVQEGTEKPSAASQSA